MTVHWIIAAVHLCLSSAQSVIQLERSRFYRGPTFDSHTASLVVCTSWLVPAASCWMQLTIKAHHGQLHRYLEVHRRQLGALTVEPDRACRVQWIKRVDRVQRAHDPEINVFNLGRGGCGTAAGPHNCQWVQWVHWFRSETETSRPVKSILLEGANHPRAVCVSCF